MKAIILERRGEMAAVLREDGTFENRRVEGAVGETVELDGKVVAFPNKRKSRWLRTAVAAVLVLSITSGTLGYMGGTASAYVSLEVEDAAVELTVNHFGRVIEVSALSEDTAELADELRGELRHRRPEDALDITMEHLRERGYLKREDAEVFAGVTSDSAARKAELKQAVERSVRSDDRPVYVSETSRAERREAMEQHVSPGRFGFERDRGGMDWEQPRPEPHSEQAARQAQPKGEQPQ